MIKFLHRSPFFLQVLFPFEKGGQNERNSAARHDSVSIHLKEAIVNFRYFKVDVHGKLLISRRAIDYCNNFHYITAHVISNHFYLK